MKINLKKLNMHRSYKIKELVVLLGVNKKTCLRWVEDGLQIIPGCKKPILIKGGDLKDFISKRKSKKRCKLNRNEFYCFRCKRPTYAKKGSIRRLNGKKIGICRVCNSNIGRIIKPRQKDYSIHAPPA